MGGIGIQSTLVPWVACGGQTIRSTNTIPGASTLKSGVAFVNHSQKPDPDCNASYLQRVQGNMRHEQLRQ